MNRFVLVLLSALCLFSLVAAEQENDYQNEFFQGMESGFFLRDRPDDYKDYDCPDLAVDADAAEILTTIMTPIEIAMGFANDPMADEVVKAMKLFAQTIMKLFSITKLYNGSEFCAGLLFGIHGTNLVINMAKMIATRVKAMTRPLPVN